jgi:DNA-binding Lrp family transcriptional regulator
MPLDILDMKVIQVLTEDARSTYKAIAEEAGVSARAQRAL